MINKDKLDKYIEKCFEDAFKSENKDYDKKWYSVNYAIIYDSKDIGHFYPLITCRYSRVLRKVRFRLRNNIKKNFELLFGDSDEFRCSVDKFICIDPNFTRAMIAKRNNIEKKFMIFIIDDLDELPITKGQYIPAYRYEKLIRNYYDLDEKDYCKAAQTDEIALPQSILQNWNEFKKLWESTFNQDICPYEIILSDGLVRL